jgi:hypothetical protein
MWPTSSDVFNVTSHSCLNCSIIKKHTYALGVGVSQQRGWKQLEAAKPRHYSTTLGDPVYAVEVE